ncbi:hypothetical protein F5B19DRAFT_153636 [Rostrohypoxylon terebratum]|nr:hypothetical protein F5B19DRAFT_153636 [Rostrohypoxylon terebratum]
MDPSRLAFSPERCADLHNRLLAKATEHSLNIQTERTLLARFLDVAPEFAQVPSLDDLPLSRFLRLLDTTPTVADEGLDLLTPFMYQPDPRNFWTDHVGHEPFFILLYCQNNGDSPLDGGVYVDIRSYQAVWHNDDSPRFPPSDQWLPLEVILQKALHAWDTGKFFWDAQESTMKVRSWTEHDVEESVAAFNRLISSIEVRMPCEDNEAHIHRRLEPLDAQSLTPFNINAFAVRFLTTAKRPSFSFVAPGIRILTPQLLNEIYGAEASDSTRRSHWLGDDEEWPTLILPGVDPVPHDVSQSSDRNINSFDQNWGFGKFTVNRQSGLYIMPDTNYSDLVCFVASSGLCTACQFRPLCRCVPPREPRLAEVFDHWTSLLENGIWTIDANGVSTDHTWFTAHTSVAQLAPVT